MHARLRLLCDTNPMCYGSSAAALSILDHIDAHRTALAAGVTLEILGRDVAVDAVIEVDSKATDRVAALLDTRQFDAVLVVSNLANIDNYALRRIPIFFVDILYWMGANKQQPVWELAQATFVEAFPGVQDRVARRESPGSPHMVGPLIRMIEAKKTTDEAVDLLVNLGGARSRFIRPGIDSRYSRLALNWLHAAGYGRPQRVVVAGGADAIADAHGSSLAAHYELACLPQTRFLQLLAATRTYVTVPGLNSVHEGLAGQAPMLLLPPQNATQVLQLKRYESEDLVAPGLNLPELDPQFDARQLDADESVLTAEVLRSLERLADSPKVTTLVGAHLRRQSEQWAVRENARSRFRSHTGPPGGRDVAAKIAEWWAGRC